MITEDLVSSYLGTSGPRAVNYSDQTAGSPGILNGRISYYVGTPERSLYYWPPSTASLTEILRSYGESYAFGAYLSRSFGGAPLFGAIVNTGNTGTSAIDYALSATGSSETFSSVYAKWGAAAILSSSTTVPAGYQYNSGTWFSSASNGINYTLGSINMFNYTDGTYIGPKTYSSYMSLPTAALSGGAEYIYDAGSLSGIQTWNMTIPAGVKVTLVAQ
jgi:hypothetical protein